MDRNSNTNYKLLLAVFIAELIGTFLLVVSSAH